ncbi:MAG TPA: hypothetical protein VFF21_01300 [Flavobacteriaceae bacterium]|nr:hypothetical protein [Flavobacteriaceae bacterium]
MKMKFTQKIAFLSVLFVFLAVASYAQIGLPGDGDPSGPGDVPINGLIALGLAAGAALGLRRKLKK